MRRKRKMRIKREEKGITLVALVITVIILLILAGVAMSLITGQNGLFARANHAGYEYTVASQTEADHVAALNSLLEQYSSGEGNGGGSQGGGQTPVEPATVHEPEAPAATTFKSTVNATNVTLTVMPESVGAAGTTYQYQIDGGEWVNPVIATETTYTFTGLTPVSEHTVNVKIGDTVQTAQTVKTGSQKTMKEVTTLADAIKYSASAISATDTTYAGTYKELTTSDGTVKVPVGFTVRYDSATTVAGGIVVADQNDNQWVWIPVNADNAYVRRIYTELQSWDTTNPAAININVRGTVTQWTETMDSVEQSAIDNGGYYIGRYEAGVEGETIMRTGATEPRTVSIKRNQVPYNYVAMNLAQEGYGNMISLCEGMSRSSASNYKSGIITKLCSSYAWDTAINFIEKTVENYGSSSPQGNYLNTAYSGGTTNDDKSLMKTGLTTSVCNIYDMGGNCLELTTEYTSHYAGHYVMRGGHYGIGYEAQPAGYRYYYNGGSNSYQTFRVTLYL